MHQIAGHDWLVRPNDCIKINRVNIEGRHPMMRIQLPSGRYLHYIDVPKRGRDALATSPQRLPQRRGIASGTQ